jgi:hypothetical protein
MGTLKIFLIIAGFAIAMIAIIAIVLIINDDMDVMGFEPKEEIARKINDKLGGRATRDLRYDEFIKLYPEGDNALYSDIKRLDVIDLPGLMSVL